MDWIETRLIDLSPKGGGGGLKMLKLPSAILILLFSSVFMMSLFSQSPSAPNPPTTQLPEIKPVFLEVNFSFVFGKLGFALKSNDKKIFILNKNDNDARVKTNEELVAAVKDLINKEPALNDLRTKLDRKIEELRTSKDDAEKYKLKYNESKSNEQEEKIAALTQTNENITNQKNKLENDSLTNRLTTLSFKNFERVDWIILIYLSLSIIVTFLILLYIATAFCIFIASKFRKFKKKASQIPSCSLAKKLKIDFDLISPGFDIHPWNAIIADIENAKKGSLWNHALECQIKDAIQNNIEININDLAFFFGEVWSKYVFQFEHDTEGWELSKKIICDSLPSTSKIGFKLRLPDIGASHSVTIRNGISVLIDSGSGPKITKIIHPGCEIINLENREIIFSMPASVEMGD